MPGKKGQAAFTFMNKYSLYRQLTTADATTPGSIDALAAEINTIDCEYAVGNRLDVQVCAPSTVSAYTVSVYATLTKDAITNLGEERWALLYTADKTASSFVPLGNVPCGYVKILITSMTGTGTITILTAKSL